MSHARLNPSGAKRWMVCAAAPRLEAAFNDSGGLAADQGTNAHALLEYGIVEGEIPIDLSTFNWPKPDAGCPPELIQQARDCLIYANNRHLEMAPAGMFTELKADPYWFTGRNDGGGTADIVLSSKTVLEIIDLKTGGTLVEASDPQLLIYAAGVLANYVNAEGNTCFKKIRMTVYQAKRPGASEVERFIEMSPEELIQWLNEVYIPAAEATDDPDAKGTPGAEQCKWCKARTSCEYKKATTEAAMSQLFLPVEPEAPTSGINAVSAQDMLLSSEPVNSMSPEELSIFLNAAPLIEARIKDARERAKEDLKANKSVPGFKLVTGRGGRKWTLDEDELAVKLRNIKLKKIQIFEEKLRSPAQIQKLGLDVKLWEKINKYIKKTTGALTLVPASDPRADACPVVTFDPVAEPKPTTELPDFLK